MRLGEIPDLIGGVPVVTADEAVIDLGRYGDPLSAWVGATALLRDFHGYHRSVPSEHRYRDHEKRAELLSKLQGLPGSRGLSRARAIFQGVDSRSESVAEAAVLWLLHTIVEPVDGELPFQPQHPVQTDELEYHVDVGFPKARVAIEFDGAGKFLDGSQTVRDHQRRRNAISEAGWLIISLLWDDFRDMESLGKKLARILVDHGIDAHAPAGPLWVQAPEVA